MLGKPLRIALGHTDVYLLPQRALYIAEHQLLVIADWHLGKIQHFRKNGLFVPQNAISDELQHLGDLIASYPTQHVVFLGDLFHSSWNADWDILVNYLAKLAPIKCSLVIGNHDLIDFESQGTSCLVVHEQWELDGLLFTHQPLTEVPAAYVNISGHIHPGYTVRTKGRQHYRLPCFYQVGQTFILPAFGKYTGLHTVRPAQDAAIYLIVGDEVLRHQIRP